MQTQFLVFTPIRSRSYTLPRVASADLRRERSRREWRRMSLTDIAPAVARVYRCRRRRIEQTHTA